MRYLFFAVALWGALQALMANGLVAYTLARARTARQHLHTALGAEMRIRIQGTKNAFTTLMTGDVVSYKMSRPVHGKDVRIGVFTEDGKIAPLRREDDGPRCVLDSTLPAESASRLREEDRLLRIYSSDRQGAFFTVNEFIDDSIYLPSAGDVPHQSSPLTVIHTLDAPFVKGAPYSQAVRYKDMLYLSGCLGVNPSTNQLAGESIEAQTSQCLANVAAVLAAGGSRWLNVVKVVLYLTDLRNFAAVNALYSTALKEHGCEFFPARTTLQISALPLGALVEIDATAVCDDSLSAP